MLKLEQKGWIEFDKEEEDLETKFIRCGDKTIVVGLFSFQI